MKKPTRLALAALIVGIVGCASFVPPVSMRGADVAANDTAPEAKNYSSKTPGVGEQKLIARTFVNQPPMIPHAIEKYEPITVDENACLECHVSDELRGKPMPKMGKSHFSTKIKDSDGNAVVEMSRFQCNSCHVPQVDAKPLVENSFIGVTK